MKEKSKKVLGIVLIGIMSLATMGLPLLVGVAQSHDQPQGTTEGIIMEFVGEIESPGDVPSPCPFAVPVLDGLVDNVYLTEGEHFSWANATDPENTTSHLYVLDNSSLDYVWIVWIINKGFVDNTWGNGTVGIYRSKPGGSQPGTHTFDDNLIESDGQRIQFYNCTNVLVFDAFFDLAHNRTWNFVIPDWGESGSEAVVYTGDESLVEYNTSTVWDINNYWTTTPYNTFYDSPTNWTTDPYEPYSGYENWESRIIFEVKLNRAIFGGCTINASATSFPYLHASPNKLGYEPEMDIPEFSTLLIPIIGMIALFAIFRKYKKK